MPLRQPEPNGQINGNSHTDDAPERPDCVRAVQLGMILGGLIVALEVRRSSTKDERRGWRAAL